ncbi:MAG: hypothetical protein QXT37_10970, partial [Thermofilaceae archaeon]
RVDYPRLRTKRILLDNSGGTQPLTAPLFSQPVMSLSASIVYPMLVQLNNDTIIDQSGGPLITVGDASEQGLTLAPGSVLETTACDLSTIHVTVPPGAKVYLEVAWEE